MIEFLFFTVVIFTGFSIIFFLKKGTFLDFKNIWSIIFYKEVVFILLPVLLLSVIDVKEFNALKMVKQEEVFFISMLVVFSFFLFSFFFLILNRIIIKSNHVSFASKSFVYESSVDYFSTAAVFSGVLLLIFSILFLGYKHAFLTSIFSGANVLHIRLQNAYSSNLPSQISYIITVAYGIAAIYSGLLATKRKYLYSFVFILIGVLLSSAGGAKAPVINLLVFFVMSLLYFSAFSLSLKKVSFSKVLLWSPVYLSVIFVALYYAVSLQIADLNMSKFFVYLFERLGVGQMAGVYETFSINFSLPESAWHMVPFASLFVDYPIFSKELMLFTENREFSDTGVKNSLFIAEAYGMGGWLLMILSPIWMAFAYIIRIFILSLFLKFAFGRSVRDIYLIPLFFLSTNLTGDFSSLALQKGTILLLLALVVFYIVGLFVKLFKRSLVSFKVSAS